MTSKRKAATARERVLAVYPLAEQRVMFKGTDWVSYIVIPIGYGGTFDKAWKDAASRLPTKRKRRASK